MQLLVLVEADLVEVRVLGDIQRKLEAEAAEEAGRGARVDVQSQPREDDGIVLDLVRQDVSLPVIKSEPAEEFGAVPAGEAVDALELVEQARVARAPRGRLAAEEKGTVIVDGAAAELAAIGPLPARVPLVEIAPARTPARPGLGYARAAIFLPLQLLEVCPDRLAGLRPGVDGHQR